MIRDCHIHLRTVEAAPRLLLDAFEKPGVEEAIVISLPPAEFRGEGECDEPRARLSHLLSFCGGSTVLRPFFWINPLAEDTASQVEEAVGAGVEGFKVICDSFPPGTPAAMETYRLIADAGKPLLFHSGILWDGKPSSSYNRPAEFEPLLRVPGLRFALAHVSWPWPEECIAVYGKFLHARGTGRVSAEMFIDITPGTPPAFRKDTLAMLFSAGYDVEHNVMFGSDCYADDYNADWVCSWYERDRRILEEAGFGPETVRRVYAENIKRFLGGDTPAYTPGPPRQAE